MPAEKMNQAEWTVFDYPDTPKIGELWRRTSSEVHSHMWKSCYSSNGQLRQEKLHQGDFVLIVKVRDHSSRDDDGNIVVPMFGIDFLSGDQIWSMHTIMVEHWPKHMELIKSHA